MKETTCKHRSPWKTMETRQCGRKAVTDGYCTRHHPSYISPQQRKAEAAHLAELNQGPREKLLSQINICEGEDQMAREMLNAAHVRAQEAYRKLNEARNALTYFDHPEIFSKRATVSRS